MALHPELLRISLSLICLFPPALSLLPFNPPVFDVLFLLSSETRFSSLLLLFLFVVIQIYCRWWMRESYWILLYVQLDAPFDRNTQSNLSLSPSIRYRSTLLILFSPTHFFCASIWKRRERMEACSVIYIIFINQLVYKMSKNILIMPIFFSGWLKPFIDHRNGHFKRLIN